MRTFVRLLALAILLVLGLAGLGWQYQRNEELRGEVMRRHALAFEQAQLENEHARLEAAQVSSADLASWREKRNALTALANEMERLRRRAALAQPAVPAARPSLRQAQLAASEWTDAGDDTALATVETALWASAHGEVETLARLLNLSEATRAHAAEVFARLPPSARREEGSPEQFVAMLTANAVPLGSAQVIAEFHDAPDVAKLVLQTSDLDGKSRELVLNLRASEGRWQVDLPDAAFARYLAALRTPAGP